MPGEKADEAEVPGQAGIQFPPGQLVDEAAGALPMCAHLATARAERGAAPTRLPRSRPTLRNRHAASWS